MMENSNSQDEVCGFGGFAGLISSNIHAVERPSIAKTACRRIDIELGEIEAVVTDTVWKMRQDFTSAAANVEYRNVWLGAGMLVDQKITRLAGPQRVLK